MLVDESKIIKRLLSTTSEKRVLNVCSSDAAFYVVKQPHILANVIQPLLERNCSIVNLDMKSSPGVDIVIDCHEMRTISDNAFDVALFCSAVEHIECPEKALREIRRVLVPEGMMIASAPGRYPVHKDPIDTLLRLPDVNSWADLLKSKFCIQSFHKTKPQRAPEKYNFRDSVFATIVETVSSKTSPRTVRS